MSARHREPAIIVVNPNSSEAVTDGMDRALAGLRRPDGPAIRCVTLTEGPPGIETDRHISEVVALRRTTDKPVFGIAETAYRRAAANGGRFGVLSIQEGSLARHRRYIGALGLTDYLAGDRPVGLGVTALGDDPAATLARLVQVGRQLKDSDGALTIVLGCTGMAPFREQLQTLLNLPVLDPVLVAAEAAIEALASADGGL
jgi:Asp/Glu/hydantoin racemase